MPKRVTSCKDEHKSLRLTSEPNDANCSDTVADPIVKKQVKLTKAKKREKNVIEVTYS